MDYPKFRLHCLTALQSKYYLNCGSYYELPRKYCESNATDLDCMFYCSDICAIPWNRNPPKNFKGTLLRIDSKRTPPGFAKLQISQDKMQTRPTYYRRPKMLSNVTNGGPSLHDTDAFTVSYKIHFEENHEVMSCDRVYAVYCPYWPPEAEEWRMRKRIHGWPDERLTARITRGGCHFVSKLRTLNDDTEWRFSFSKAELILIHSWTAVQKTVYHVIRVFKSITSKHCRDDDNKILQTYYFKTLMLWACESWPQEFWCEENIGNCVGRLLLQFRDCLANKNCCHYFISENNIMSDLKVDVTLEKELMLLLNYGENISLTDVNISGTPICRFLYAAMPFEHYCLYLLDHIFPLSEDLNGRFGHYLSKCEWFLPGMKFLHEAIETNLRLMSINGVVARRESGFHDKCLDSFNCALIKSKDYESFGFRDPDLSLCENVKAILRRKLLKNSIPIYRRNVAKSPKDAEHELIYRENFPAPLQLVVSVYKANFYFTALQSYRESLSECKECFYVYDGESKSFELNGRELNDVTSEHIPILVSNSLSPIFDEHLQVILGFATLHKYLSSSQTSNSSSAQELCLKLNPWEFLKYLYIQCECKMSIKTNIIRCSFPLHLDIDRPSMSQLTENGPFSAAILYAALRQSRAYEEPLIGDLIPRHFRRSKQISGSISIFASMSRGNN